MGAAHEITVGAEVLVSAHSLADGLAQAKALLESY
jgi:hypothetical protein